MIWIPDKIQWNFFRSYLYLLLQLTTKDLNTSLQKEIYRYAKTNLAKVNIYIKDPYVAKYVTEEKITEIAFVGEFYFYKVFT